MSHLSRLVPAVFVGLAAIACGQESPSASAGPDRSVAWALQITSQAEFGVRVWLDGEAIYSQASPLAQSHRVEVQRPYAAGSHVVQFEVLAASINPSTYTAAWTVHVTPTGPFFTADGVPTALTVGERLTLQVAL
jgi:hypothetical protein